MAKTKRKATRRTAPPEMPASTSGWTAAWQRLPERTQHLVCLLFLLLVAFGFFAPVVFTDQALVGGDVVRWRAMAEAMLDYRAETGEQALWNPNAFAGMPGYMTSYADEIPQADDLPRLLRQVIWPVSHFLFLLLGVYLLVVFLARDKLAALLASVAYGLTTYLPVLLIAGHNSKFVALSFAPWLVLAFAYALRRPAPLSALLFAIALAVNLRAGHVQITYYITFLLGVWWIAALVGAVREGQLKPFAVSTGWMALGAVLALLMVAHPYLAHYEYKAFTIRGAASGAEGAAGEGGLDFGYAMAWSQGVGELLTLLVAHAYGGGGATYWGPKTFTAGPHYVGGIVLLLAFLAVYGLHRKAVWGLGVAALLMTLFALGEHFGLLNRLMFEVFPLFDAFRAPETWLSAVAFALAVLAGLGLFWVVRREASPEAERKKTRAVYAAAGVLTAFVALLLVFQDVFFDFEKPGEAAMVAQQIAAANNVSPDDPRVAQAAQSYLAEQQVERREAFRGDAVRTLLFLLLAGAGLVAFRREKLPAWTLQAALVLLVLVDLWGVGRRYLNEEALVDSPDVEEQIPTYGFDRFILERQEEAGGAGHFRVLSLEQGDPMVNPRPSYHFESVGGYHGAKLRIFQDYIDHLFVDRRRGRLSENALDLLNTRYVIGSGGYQGLRAVYQDEQTGLAVYENPDALPRAFFVGQTEVVETAEATWERIQSEAFDLRRTALLMEPVDFETTPIDSGSVAEVTLESYSPREIVWQVRTDAPRLLVASEIYYPAGWQATVGDEEVPIYRVDYMLRGVPVPEGSHTVRMRFDPESHRLGLLVAGTTTALVYGATLLLLGLAWRRRRTEPGPEGGERPGESA